MSHDIQSYLRLMVKHGGSDLFLSPGAPATVKIDGLSRPMTDQSLNGDSVQALAYSLLTPDEIVRFEQDLELNKAVDLPEIGRFRVNFYRQRGMAAMVARHIRTEIPSIAELGMPVVLEKLVMEQRGLILLTGAAGSGKSTTLASMIDHRNRLRPGHILTIEDPVEFLHSHKKSIVDQREIGLDTHSFGNALRNAMREAPDVIAIGEIRDMESLRYALAYAETGHLCLATLHASNAHQALERVLNFYDQQHHPQVLLDLSLHLRAIVSQRLLRGIDGKRIPAAELLLNTPFVAELIQTGRIDEISTALAQHNQNGMCSFDQSLFHLWKAGRISKEEALTHADSRANLSVLMRLDATPEDLAHHRNPFDNIRLEEMNLRDLQYLIAVADLRNFSQAANRCCVSQPTLSNQIRKLEETLGVVVFERSNKRVMPTETGEQIIALARKVLREVDAMHDVAQSAQDPLAGKFRLGAFPTLSTYIFPALVPKITAQLPQLKLVLVEEKTQALLDRLKRGELDAALLALPVNDEQLAVQKLFDDEFLLAVPPDHPLASKKQVTQEDFGHCKLLLLEEGHCLRDQALEVCHLAGIEEEQDFRATSLETLRQMVKAGTGITFMPKIAIQPDESGIRYIPFGKPAPYRSIALVWRKTSARTAVIEQLLGLLR